MTRDSDDVAREDDGASCMSSAPVARLAASIAKLSFLIDSGALASSLSRVMLLDEVRHGERHVSAHDADVVAQVASLARAVPLSRLEPRQVERLPRLTRSGFLIVENGKVRVTSRGHALAAARVRARSRSRASLRRLRDALSYDLKV